MLCNYIASPGLNDKEQKGYSLFFALFDAFAVDSYNAFT